jgi:hypothetical protein
LPAGAGETFGVTNFQRGGGASSWKNERLFTKCLNRQANVKEKRDLPPGRRYFIKL